MWRLIRYGFLFCVVLSVASASSANDWVDYTGQFCDSFAGSY